MQLKAGGASGGSPGPQLPLLETSSEAEKQIKSMGVIQLVDSSLNARMRPVARALRERCTASSNL